jgi:hypothetical protein
VTGDEKVLEESKEKAAGLVCNHGSGYFRYPAIKNDSSAILGAGRLVTVSNADFPET